jgi:hypothetical protein
MKNRTLNIGWCEILTRNPNGEMGTLIGNIRQVGKNTSEVEIPKWNGNKEEIVTRTIPNCFLTNTN